MAFHFLVMAFHFFRHVRGCHKVHKASPILPRPQPTTAPVWCSQRVENISAREVITKVDGRLADCSNGTGVSKE